MSLEIIFLQALFDFTEVCAGNIGDDETIIEACRFDTEFLQSTLIPFNLVTGGLLPAIFWGVIALAVYIKYHNFILSAMIGVPIMLTASFALPQYAEIYFSILLIIGVAVTIFILIWKVPRD